MEAFLKEFIVAKPSATNIVPAKQTTTPPPKTYWDLNQIDGSLDEYRNDHKLTGAAKDTAFNALYKGGLEDGATLSSAAYNYFFQTTNGMDNGVVGLANQAGIIVTGNGKDNITGGNLGDMIFAGNGMDTVQAGGGNDIVYGENGVDRLFGEAGDDKLYGGNSDDIVSGGDGADSLYGGLDNDLLSGNAGNDLAYGGAGSDTVLGDDGNDQLFGDDGDDSVSGGAGADQIDGGTGNDQLFGDSGNDTIAGGDGIDAILGGTDNGVSHAQITIEHVPGETITTVGTYADYENGFFPSKNYLPAGSEAPDGASHITFLPEGMDSPDGWNDLLVNYHGAAFSAEQEGFFKHPDGHISRVFSFSNGSDDAVTIHISQSDQINGDGGVAERDVTVASGTKMYFCVEDASLGDQGRIDIEGSQTVTVTVRGPDGGTALETIAFDLEHNHIPLALPTITTTTPGYDVEHFSVSVAGGDQLHGGAGADTFTYRAGDGVDTIHDLNGAEGDRIQLVGITADQVTLRSDGTHTYVLFNNGDAFHFADNAAIVVQNTTDVEAVAQDIVYL
jgi:Ca2+-binding RTX toxin-like protein